jgi:rubredoxin
MRKFKCSICGYIYDEAAGVPEKGFTPDTKWESIPESFACPGCTAPKPAFNSLEGTIPPSIVSTNKVTEAVEAITIENFKGFTTGEISAICSSLAKGCEKQRLQDEMEAFNKIADYFESKTGAENGKTLEDVAKMLADDMTELYPAANKTATDAADRGAQRSLVWSEKVSIMAKLLIERFTKEGEAMLENTNVKEIILCRHTEISAFAVRIACVFMFVQPGLRIRRIA